MSSNTSQLRIADKSVKKKNHKLNKLIATEVVNPNLFDSLSL